MIRIIADTQSNAHFLGSAMEQSYDQRGGLCQLGRDDILVTSNPIDSDFLAYWQGIGFELPTLIIAGPSDGSETLSELIMKNGHVRDSIYAAIQGRQARLEFFCIEETERQVARYLGIDPYCTFDIAIPYSRKPAGKRLFWQLHLRTPFGTISETMADLEKFARPLLTRSVPILVKAEDGTGGIACNGMHAIGNEGALDDFINNPPRLGSEFVIEERVVAVHEVSVHWEITTEGKLLSTGIFNQHSPNLGYQGASWPPSIPDTIAHTIEEEVQNEWYPLLTAGNAIGHFCCDVIIDAQGLHYWIDFNPRKGAIRYVHDLAQKVARMQFNQESYGCFWHEHIKLPARRVPYSFREIRDCLGGLLNPSNTVSLVASNPGVIPFGYVDITGIAKDQHTDMRGRFEEARTKLLAT